ncbi:MAG TPA: ATP-binding protein [Oscillospiraceae bacterium]|mgnify:CR=1 FL=1|nr:ATP-binding protein [Oscillospiraceae bacterium]HPS34677.1 ATP-binding protein [Oscillospiraceae bacterium]
MAENIKLHYDVDGSDFTTAGAASSDTKRILKKIGIPPDAVRRVSIAMYEGEINMVIHADGGAADVEIGEHSVTIKLVDHGPGIPDIGLAMQEGWSTAPEEVRNLGFGAGMGLPNMKKYSDTFEITSQVGVGTKVIMTVNF